MSNATDKSDKTVAASTRWRGGMRRSLPCFGGGLLALLVLGAGVCATTWRSPLLVQDTFRDVSEYSLVDLAVRHVWGRLGLYNDSEAKFGKRRIHLEIHAPLAPIHFGIVAAARLSWLFVLACLVYHWRVFPYFVQRGAPRCRRCGYTLRGLRIPRCPECGECI